MKKLSEYISLGLIILLLFVFSQVGFSQPDFLLSSTNMAPANTVRLHWTWIPPQALGTYGYTLFQWDDLFGDWQSTSTQCDKTIKVLNVYPYIEGSNTLKTWMDDPAIGFEKIEVTPVSIIAFNNTPDAFLKEGSGKYIYDVIMFGSWDSNNGFDISLDAATAVRKFLNTGRGVLFGHDTQTSDGGHPHFVSLRDKTNLDIDPSDNRDYLWRGSTNIKVVNNGYLLNYPHTIPSNVNLTVPSTHTTGQTAKGVVWMNFPNTIGSNFTNPVQIVNGGTNDFYLTTWNNAAMIQTGHSNGQATRDEKEIIANTLWYLAQYTMDTTVDACFAWDITPPAAPTAIGLCNQVYISSCDNGTIYRFYVKAINTENSDSVFISNEITVENKTGICGYFISEDADPSGVPPIVYDTSNNIITPLTLIAADCEHVTYTLQDPTRYVHIQAMDCAGNLSEVITVKSSFSGTDTLMLYDAICCNTNYNEHGFAIPATDLNETGVFSYQRFVADTSGCDSVILLYLTVNPIPDINITAISGDFCKQNFVELEIKTNGDSFLWNTGSTESSVILSESGVYSVTASLGDCKKTAYYTIEECPPLVTIFTPDAFIPGSNNIPNNYFFATGLENYFTISICIFNRWGEPVFQSHDPDFKWDGTLHGKPCPQGVYVWELSYHNEFGKQYKKNGAVMLIR